MSNLLILIIVVAGGLPPNDMLCIFVRFEVIKNWHWYSSGELLVFPKYETFSDFIFKIDSF